MARLGQGAYLGIGLVSGYSTNGAAADIDLHYTVDGGHDSIAFDRARIEFDDLTAEYMDANLLAMGQKRVGGSFSINLPYAALQDLVRIITGHNVAATGIGPYDYAFVPVSRASASHHVFGSTPRHVVLEVHRGGGNANSTFYQGIVFTSVQFAYEEGSYVRFTANVVGRGYTVGPKSTPTYLANFAKVPTGQSTRLLTLGAVEYVTKSATLTIDQGLEERFDVTDVEMEQPLPGTKQTLTIEARVEVDNEQTFLDALDQQSEDSPSFSAARLFLNDGTHELDFNFDAASLRSPVEPRAAGIGVLHADLSMDVYSDDAAGPAYTVDLLVPTNVYLT